jgi:hypothetical protein
MKQRNSLLLLQNFQGILSAYLQDEELLAAAHQSLSWSDDPRKGIESLWRDEPDELKKLKSGFQGRSIRILDSFFSDTLTKNDIRDPIFSRAIKGVPVQFLLADPKGPFGKARAEAIGQSAIHRSLEGLQRLSLSCNSVRKRHDGRWVSREREIIACNKEDDWDKAAKLLREIIDGLPVEIRLYQENPNCPLYFFSDLLIVGRFWVDTTAADRPWEHIIDTPINGDLYDIMLREFYAVWNRAQELAAATEEKSPTGNKTVFISCCKEDEKIVLDLEKRIKASGFDTFVFFSDVPTGTAWPPEIREQLLTCGLLVAVLSQKALNNSDWIRAEVGAAWALGKHIMQANVGNDPKILPGILDRKWKKDVASDTGKEELVADIKKILNS